MLGVVAHLDVARLGPGRFGHGAAKVLQPLVLRLARDDVDEVGSAVVGVGQLVVGECQVHLRSRKVPMLEP